MPSRRRGLISSWPWPAAGGGAATPSTPRWPRHDTVTGSIGRVTSTTAISRPCCAGAEVVAYPARQEGFGLPALEALACGTPLITTAGSVMADMAGTAAVLVTPGSVDDLAGAIGAVLDGGAGAERRRAGLDVAARHTWDAAAAGHVAAYRWAMTAPSPPGGRARGR